ncbi:hypothetical protein MKW98_008116 [Papaver atlanticum]|uniref:Uncharacterized protein n=1 Tax=Papaver atlanticum TaxID=357466 RepID=A0AAD4S7S6_9MAGN|nr:hypothetical protein MKW98_008116 [Papaver atlanticum]
MARKYVRSIVSSIQRVALALPLSNLSPQSGLRPPPGSPEAQTLAHWISNSYRRFMGAELLKFNGEASESILKTLWHQSDPIMYASLSYVGHIPAYLLERPTGLELYFPELLSPDYKLVTIDASLPENASTAQVECIWSANVQRETHCASCATSTNT